MKKLVLFYIVLMTALSLMLPSISMFFTHTESSSGPAKARAAAYFRVYISESGRIRRVAAEDYVFGVVASEMSPSSEPEALKAQAVAAYTFALRRKRQNANREYDLTDSEKSDQHYTPREDLLKKWGSNAAKYEKSVLDAVRAVSGYAILDSDGAPILAMYHAVSPGKTESSEVMFGGAYSYLTPVDSVCDLLSPDYLSQAQFTAAEFKKKLSPLVDLSGREKDWLGKIEYSPSGTAKTVELCGKKVTGRQIQSALGLRSAAFDLLYDGKSFTFRVKGWGHGVGMSQFGAQYLAKQGFSYVEILSHYYTGCVMKKVQA